MTHFDGSPSSDFRRGETAASALRLPTRKAALTARDVIVCARTNARLAAILEAFFREVEVRVGPVPREYIGFTANFGANTAGSRLSVVFKLLTGEVIVISLDAATGDVFTGENQATRVLTVEAEPQARPRPAGRALLVD